MRENKRIHKRKKIKGTYERSRLSIFRSNRYLFAQIIDDEKGETLIGLSDKNFLKTDQEKNKKIDSAKKLGMLLAQKAREKNIKKIVFDRSRYLYHGRVKAVADGAREGGLEF